MELKTPQRFFTILKLQIPIKHQSVNHLIIPFQIQPISPQAPFFLAYLQFPIVK